MRLFSPASKKVTLALLVLALHCSWAASRLTKTTLETDEWSACTRTCGGGVQEQISSECSYPGDPECKSKPLQYRMCNTQPCAKGSVSFRDVQCSKFNTKEREFESYFYHLEPCALYCVEKRALSMPQRMSLVTDGTKCDPLTRNVCLQGRCKVVGCDGVPGSLAKRDVCGVCGGNGSSCADNPERALFAWHVTSVSPCSVTCGSGSQSVHAVCRKKSTRKTVGHSHCKTLPKPSKQVKCELSPCGTRWHTGEWEPCSATCGSGYSLRAVYCSSLGENGKRQKTYDKRCAGVVKPIERRICKLNPCPEWKPLEWKKCSESCSGGTQERDIRCVSPTGDEVSTSQCDSNNKPQNKRKCNLQPCETDREDFAADEFNMALPNFLAGEWSACSTTCGLGRRTRKVTCRVFFPFSDKSMELPDDECEGKAPTSEEDCNLRKCDSQLARDSADSSGSFAWRTVAYSACSASCLGGEERAITKCFNTFSNRAVTSDHCRRNVGPAPDLRRACNDIPCPPQWKIGEFGSCSEWCGGGFRNRTVTCRQTSDHGDTLMPDAFCPHPKPQSKMTCAQANCPPMWETGEWTKCPSSCGVRTRNLTCTQRLASGQLASHGNGDETPCKGLLRPTTEKECGRCRKPKIVIQQLNTVQMRKMKRLSVTVGGSATVLPETSISVKCPVKKYDRKNIVWLKNSRSIKDLRRVRVSGKGVLKIRKSRPSDSGMYTCIAADARASITIDFQSPQQGQKLLKERTIILRKIRKAQKKKDSNEFGMQADQASQKDHDKNTKKHRKGDKGFVPVFVTGEWSACSTSCGPGSRERQVQCEVLTKSYFQVLDDQECLIRNSTRPHDKEFCQESPVCAHWRTGDWDECLTDHCIAPKVAERFRAISCIAQNNSKLSDSACDSLKRPASKSECHQPECIAQWTTNAWSQCSKTCGRGTRHRGVGCFWKASGKPSSLCVLKERPTNTERCRVVSCRKGKELHDDPGDEKDSDSECKDKSPYCNLYEMLEMCAYESYREQCCHTCSVKYKAKV